MTKRKADRTERAARAGRVCLTASHFASPSASSSSCTAATSNNFIDFVPLSGSRATRSRGVQPRPSAPRIINKNVHKKKNYENLNQNCELPNLCMGPTVRVFVCVSHAQLTRRAVCSKNLHVCRKQLWRCLRRRNIYLSFSPPFAVCLSPLLTIS